MAESLRSKVEEHLTCSVCLEQLKDPKVLPCLHSYCHECIVRLARNAKSINCPECRVTVKVDDPQNISTFPSNFFVNNLLATMALTNEKAAKTIVCDVCDSGDLAETRCKECGIFLCQYCTGFHRRSRATKAHELVSMDELKSNVGPEAIAETIRCPKHKEEVIKLFCKTCQVTICRDCTIVDHRQHEYGFVEDVAFQEKQKLQKNLDEVKQRKVRVVQGISSLKKFDEGLMAKQNSTISEINKHFDDLVKVMAVRRRELIAKATLLTSLKQKQIHAQLEQLEMALATCDSSIEFTEQAFKNGNDVQILSMEKCILQSLENLKEVKDQTQPCVSEQIVFSIPSSLPSSVKNARQTLFNEYAVDDVVVSPEDCTASFTDGPETHLEFAKQSSITVICNDKDERRLRFGGQLVKPMFSGVEVSNVTVTDNKDGSHVVKFTPTNQGMLKFEATVDGKPAPLCSLTKSVKWAMSDAYGSGPITNNGLTMSGHGPNREYCWRVGGCYFESGVHTWKVRLQHKQLVYPRGMRGGFEYKRDLEEYGDMGRPRYGDMRTEIGIIDCGEINGDALNSQKKWVYTFTEDQNVDISLMLDMENRTLQITYRTGTANRKSLGKRQPRLFGGRDRQFQFAARRVLPFFACSSPSVTLSLVDVE